MEWGSCTMNGLAVNTKCIQMESLLLSNCDKCFSKTKCHIFTYAIFKINLLLY